jgi:hypothetical protein
MNRIKKNQKWDRKDIIASLDEFKRLYESPKFLIESGVWKGLGTWLFEQASPKSKIISIDPEPRNRIYTSPKVDYRTIDFLTIDWKSILDPSETLAFFDDHQNCLPRIQRCYDLGIKKIIVEDNYPVNQGDCYSPKKIFSQKDFIIDSSGSVTHHHNNPEHFKFLSSIVDIYEEMPPIFKSSKTRWGDDWSDINYPTPEPLLEENQAMKYSQFAIEKLDYTWICYIELK